MLCKDLHNKGKVERNFRTLKERWLYGLDISHIHSLDEFNELLAAYIRKHNTTEHSSTGETPLSRYLHSGRPVRKPQSTEWLDECFLNRTTRRVSRDATVELDCRCYDAPMQFIGQKVEVRYLPDDPEKVWVFSEEKRYPMRLTDRVENGKTKRANQVSIDYSAALGGGEDVH